MVKEKRRSMNKRYDIVCIGMALVDSICFFVKGKRIILMITVISTIARP